MSTAMVAAEQGAPYSEFTSATFDAPTSSEFVMNTSSPSAPFEECCSGPSSQENLDSQSSQHEDKPPRAFSQLFVESERFSVSEQHHAGEQVLEEEKEADDDEDEEVKGNAEKDGAGLHGIKIQTDFPKTQLSTKKRANEPLRNEFLGKRKASSLGSNPEKSPTARTISRARPRPRPLKKRARSLSVPDLSGADDPMRVHPVSPAKSESGVEPMRDFSRSESAPTGSSASCSRWNRYHKWLREIKTYNSNVREQRERHNGHEQEALFKEARARMAAEFERQRERNLAQELAAAQAVENRRVWLKSCGWDSTAIPLPEGSLVPDLSSRDPYLVLGLDRSAESSKIRQRYRKLALMFHPDKNITKDATQARRATKAFCAFTAAYRLLARLN
mmetsp:Transcript_21960/g.41191  ORF Transcript_21960/g.41191 Transcript_21960/m.41191 type:complete len:389 (-) Transcript_21960:76-1242(-)